MAEQTKAPEALKPAKKANLSMKQYGMVLALVAVFVIFAILKIGRAHV